MVRPLFKKYEDLSIEVSKTKLGTETKDVSIYEDERFKRRYTE